MNRLTYAILFSAVAMFTTLMIFDVYQLITTPLSPYGANHWIPEALAIFLFGRLLTKRKIKLHLILLGVFIYTPLVYWLMYGSLASVQLGIGTSSVFVAVLIMGVWSGSRKEEKWEVT